MKLVLFSGILSLMLVSVFGINCYQCNSNINAECHSLQDYNPHLTSKFYKECAAYADYNGSIPFCRKTVFLVKYPDDEKRTIRSCGWIKSNLACYKADNDDHEETNCQCFDDGCNGSNQIKVFSLLPFLIVVYIYLLL